ncbi:hypothetical protein [Streptomyces cadmiisoli]
MKKVSIAGLTCEIASAAAWTLTDPAADEKIASLAAEGEKNTSDE